MQEQLQAGDGGVSVVKEERQAGDGSESAVKEERQAGDGGVRAVKEERQQDLDDSAAQPQVCHTSQSACLCQCLQLQQAMQCWFDSCQVEVYPVKDVTPCLLFLVIVAMLNVLLKRQSGQMRAWCSC